MPAVFVLLIFSLYLCFIGVYLVLEMVIFSRFGAPLKHRYKEKIRNTKTADILLLERLPEQIVTNFEVFTPYCTVPYI